MDELKKHIQLHRDELDTEKPGELSWQHTRARLQTSKRAKSISLYTRWAVAACLIIAVGVLVYVSPAKRDKEPMAAIETGKQPDSTVNTPKKDSVPAAVIEDKQKNTVARKSAPARAKKKRQASPPPVYGFEGIEASYAAMVDLQRERLRMQPIYGENADYFDLFKKQFAALNQDEKRVKQEVKKTGLQDTHLDELISIYQEKINVLKQLQFEINRINTRYKQADPDINTRPASYINL